VDRFRYPALADPRLTFQIQPPEWAFGNFMRGACERYWAVGMYGLDRYLFDRRADFELIASADDPEVVRLLLSHSMWPGCSQLYQA
jgi:hypothetical protein